MPNRSHFGIPIRTSLKESNILFQTEEIDKCSGCIEEKGGSKFFDECVDWSNTFFGESGEFAKCTEKMGCGPPVCTGTHSEKRVPKQHPWGCYLDVRKNGGHFQSISAHDPFQ